MKHDLRKLQLTELKILCEFDRVCRKNKIKYSIGFGTLLGAVRGKGFIPWDDDIDIMMTYDEYMKFEKIAQTELKDEFYFQSRNVNPENFIYWNRIGLKNTTSIDMKFNTVKADWGICIDIFPIVPIPIDKKNSKKQKKRLRILTLLSLKYFHVATFKGSSLKDKIKKLPHILIPKFLNKKLTQYYCKKIGEIKFNESKQCIHYLAYEKTGEFESSWFNDYTEIEFENKKFTAIKNQHEFLSAMYGDYMTPPDEKNREKHSDNPNVVIDYENSYHKYLKK